MYISAVAVFTNTGVSVSYIFGIPSAYPDRKLANTQESLLFRIVKVDSNQIFSSSLHLSIRIT